MDALRDCLIKIDLLKLNAETKSRLAEMVEEVYAEAWHDGYDRALEDAAAGRFAQVDKAVL
jgi:hypothetical protein